MSSLYFRKASIDEAPAIANLVNEAYRPLEGAGGWTSESHLVSGDRASVGLVRKLVAAPSSSVLVGLVGAGIVACAHVECHGTNAHIGMIAVQPRLQASGTGSALLAYAEAYSSSVMRATDLIMVVLEPREQLIAFYQRRGYVRTGRMFAYPRDAGYGTPTHDTLNMVEMHKRSSLARDESLV